jgi:hypothetical protein
LIIIEVLVLSLPEDAVLFVVPLGFDLEGVDFDLGVGFVSLSSFLILSDEVSFLCFFCAGWSGEGEARFRLVVPVWERVETMFECFLNRTDAELEIQRK